MGGRECWRNGRVQVSLEVVVCCGVLCCAVRASDSLWLDLVLNGARRCDVLLIHSSQVEGQPL